jgi:hypothetical protein
VGFLWGRGLAVQAVPRPPGAPRRRCRRPAPATARHPRGASLNAASASLTNPPEARPRADARTLHKNPSPRRAATPRRRPHRTATLSPPTARANARCSARRTPGSVATRGQLAQIGTSKWLPAGAGAFIATSARRWAGLSRTSAQTGHLGELPPANPAPGPVI